MIYKRLKYNEAKTQAEEYISKMRELGYNFGIQEGDMLADYLLHDIFIYVALTFSKSQFTSFTEDYSIESLIKCHSNLREQYEEEVSYLHEEYDNVDYRTRAVNFYVKGAYVNYGLDDNTALKLVSRLTSLSEEELIKLKRESDENKVKTKSKDI